MSGVWVFRSVNGVVRLRNEAGAKKGHSKVLYDTATNEVITSYAVLESKLCSLGWERFYGDPDQLQFRKPYASLDIISIPRDFHNFNSMHMHDVMLKNRNAFQVIDA